MTKLKRFFFLFVGFLGLGYAIAQVVGTPPIGFWQRKSDCPAGSKIFNANGTFIVPQGCSSVTFYAWGGGGGAGKTNLQGRGGGGGYSTRTLTGLTDGQSFTVLIGMGGVAGACGAGTGGVGGYNGGNGSSATGTAGTAGSGGVAGGSGGTKQQTGSNGGQGRYGGGGGGAAGDGGGNVNSGGGGGGATVIRRDLDNVEVLIAGGGGGGGAEYGGDSGESAGTGGAGCAQNGANAVYTGDASEGFGGGGGGGACVGDSTQNGSGATPGNNTDAYGAGTGGVTSTNYCSLSRGKNGKVIVDYGTNAGADITPYGVEWSDFTSQSESQPIFGINTTITLEISVVHDLGTPTTFYQKNEGTLVQINPGTPETVSISNRDQLQFEVTSPTDGDKATFTIRNVTDNSRLIDSFQGTTKKCSGTEVGGYCWYMSTVFGECETICSEHGGYSAVTRTYAGDQGTNAQCDAVLIALGSSDLNGTSASSSCSQGTGCTYTSSGGNTRCTNIATSSTAIEMNFGTRACACKF